jgi:N-acetylmuramoyl-L-alanine amidase
MTIGIKRNGLRAVMICAVLSALGVTNGWPVASFAQSAGQGVEQTPPLRPRPRPRALDAVVPQPEALRATQKPLAKPAAIASLSSPDSSAAVDLTTLDREPDVRNSDAVPTTTRRSDLSALARIEPSRSSIISRGATLSFELGVTQSVPFRAFLLDSPPRLVVDFREVDFTGLEPKAMMGATGLVDLRWGNFRPGWSRLVAELAQPMAISAARARTIGDPAIQVRLVPVDQAAFNARAGAPQSALWDLPQPAAVPPQDTRQRGERPLLVVLDPGHGGIDPGAQSSGQSEAVLMMTFARELKETMSRAGMRVLLTREENVFVPLETRLTLARAAGADVFLSLHADALESGTAEGATVYTFSPDKGDRAAQQMAARHDRGDLLSGVDLRAHDDEVAGVLMDLARAETEPRAARLSVSLVAAIKDAGLAMHRHPAQTGAFSVLKSPDFPAALLELGFLSSTEDRARLNDPEWRGRMSDAIVTGLQAWARGDAAEADLLRQ